MRDVFENQVHPTVRAGENAGVPSGTPARKRLCAKENSMNSQETAQALMDSIQRGDIDRAKSLLSDDFQLSGLVRRPINGGIWLMNDRQPQDGIRRSGLSFQGGLAHTATWSTAPPK
jgi:hypothetical protein